MNDFVGTKTRTVRTRLFAKLTLMLSYNDFFVSDTPLVSTILSAPDVILVLF